MDQPKNLRDPHRIRKRKRKKWIDYDDTEKVGHIKGGGDKYHIVRIRIKIIDPADRKRVDEPTERFINQRPEDPTLQIMLEIVKSCIAAENARKLNHLMHSFTGAPAIRDGLKPRDGIMISRCFRTSERPVDIRSAEDVLLGEAKRPRTPKKKPISCLFVKR